MISLKDQQIPIMFHPISIGSNFSSGELPTPHVHSLLWMKNEDQEDAPNFYFSPNDPEHDSTDGDNDSSQDNLSQSADLIKERMKKIEEFADSLISTNPLDIRCDVHENKKEDRSKCEGCLKLIAKVQKYQTHKHTFTCAKKRKSVTIKRSEGH